MFSILGNVHMCPTLIYLYSLRDGGYLTQIGDICYELVPIKMPWHMARINCEAKSGHLIEIPSEVVQVYTCTDLKEL